MNNLDWLIEFENELQSINNEKKLFEVKNIYVKKFLNPLHDELRQSENKKELGLKIKEIKNKIDEIFDNNLSRIQNSEVLDKSDDFSDLNINIYNNGNRHLISTTINEIINFFKLYNFDFINGNEITTDVYNFENLNIPKDHPARDTHDTFYLNENLLLRTHCTSSTAKILDNNQNNDIRIISYGNVYRKDEDDATHSHQFTQIDIIWLKNGFSLANLKFLINELIKYLFGDHLKTRYRLSYFPFTEPSFEVDVQCFNCMSHGCNVCKHTGWIEILGAGMLNQNVIKKANIKNINSGLAAGIGVERIVMLKYKISDIRDLYNNDFDINKQFLK